MADEINRAPATQAVGEYLYECVDTLAARAKSSTVKVGRPSPGYTRQVVIDYISTLREVIDKKLKPEVDETLPEAVEAIEEIPVREEYQQVLSAYEALVPTINTRINSTQPGHPKRGIIDYTLEQLENLETLLETDEMTADEAHLMARILTAKALTYKRGGIRDLAILSYEDALEVLPDYDPAEKGLKFIDLSTY